MLGQGWLNSAAEAALVAVVPLGLVFSLWLLIFRRSAAPRLAELESLNGQLTAALAEKTAAEHAQAQSEAHFRGAFESHAVGQVHYEPQTGVVIRANRAYAAMLGYTPEELVGTKASEVTHPEDRGRGRYRELMDDGLESYAREKRHIRKDGSIVWGRVSATLVREPDGGEPLALVTFVEDIDDRRRAILALEEAKANLERVVDERTAALAQRDLLLREVYHRVKNNLQVVDSLLLLQARRLVDPDARAALENLRSRVYALGLVHHQLMGSKDLETFDIAPFLEELSRHLLEGGGRTGITLSVRAAPLSVGLDFASPLGLLVTELVTNSMKHAFPAGEGAVEVALDWVGANELVLSVRDDGVGYDAAAKPATPSLGASIIDGLVRQLRGQMTVTADAGTRTVVRLPAPGGSA